MQIEFPALSAHPNSEVNLFHPFLSILPVHYRLHRLSDMEGLGKKTFFRIFLRVYISEIIIGKFIISAFHTVYKHLQFILHFFVKIPFPHQKIIFTLFIKSQLIIKGIDNQQIQHYIILIV